ncbi:Orf143 [Heliothis zea nudivirus]|uniref:Uncharacterized protein n=2 Tax=Betanudivirus hezeae TaxID=3052000 RepID=G9I035_HZNV2|nr:Orf143 [Heliothis zea nudivirus]YP_004956757.1 orf9 gene product [Helicoverpa zea nudivirus 2]AAN04435.1 Orf143 [Heliothis zea nudivirus]AEW69558.1 hypothetical protein Hz2V009 [Helicoverpa zea nudivirus 2]WCZ68489.1 hypothetical protein HvNV009 [Heliothis virescens nudivirus]
MHGLILLLTFVTCIFLILNKNNWIQQELELHRTLACMPFLNRDFILYTYHTFAPLCEPEPETST